MILWFTIVQIVIACAAGLFCLILGFAGRRPSDYSVGSVLLMEVLLIVQAVIAIIAPLAGNPPTGDLLEYWVYLIGALLLPAGGVVWALLSHALEHSRSRRRRSVSGDHAVADADDLDRADRVIRAD